MSMIVACIAALASVALNIVVLVSSDPDENVTRKLNWSHGMQKEPCSINGCFKIYLGVTDFITQTDSVQTKTDWSSNECSASFCNKCEETMKAVLAFSALCLVFSVPSLFINCCRATYSGNTGCTKYCSIFLTFFAVVCGIIAVVSFSQGCKKPVVNYTTDTVTWYDGPAWILMVIVSALKFLDFMINLCVPYVDIIRV